MRYYVMIDGGGDLSWLAEGAGKAVGEAAAANLRRLRILTGMDYQAFDVRGELLNRVGSMSVSDVERLIRAGDAERGRSIAGLVRLVVSQLPVADRKPTGFGLLIGMHEGDEFAWTAGSGS